MYIAFSSNQYSYGVSIYRFIFNSCPVVSTICLIQTSRMSFKKYNYIEYLANVTTKLFILLKEMQSSRLISMEIIKFLRGIAQSAENTMFCFLIQSALGFCRGLIPGPLWMPKSTDAQVPTYKIALYLHINYTHPLIYFKSSLGHL